MSPVAVEVLITAWSIAACITIGMLARSLLPHLRSHAHRRHVAAKYADPKCTCRGNVCGDPIQVPGFKYPGRTFKCQSCWRVIPWCFGADDDMPYDCDDCWGIAHRKLGKAS